MVDETKNEQETKLDSSPTPETVTIPVQGAPGAVTLDVKSELAILVTMDTRSGQVAVYDVLNCAYSAYSRMLLNEATRLYDMKAISGLTVATLEARMAEAGKTKKNILNPFEKKG